MNVRSKKLTPIVVVGIVTLSCGLLAYFSIVSFPPAETIATQYLDAIQTGDWDAAIKLAASDTACQDAIRESAQSDIDQFTRAEIRNVVMKVYAGTGSQFGLQSVSIEFEYRKPSETEWRLGEMRIMTHHVFLGFRYTCGNALSQ